MKNVVLIIVILTSHFCSLLCSNSFGQPTFAQENQIGLSRVLAMGGVPQDLGMTQIEQALLMDAWLVTQKGLVQAFSNYQKDYSNSLPDDAKQQLLDELKTSIKQVRDDEVEKLKTVLDEEQMERLRQIRFQYLRRQGNTIEGLKEKLELSDAQIENIKQLAQESGEEIQKARKDATELELTPNELMDQVRQIRNDLEDQILNVMTAKQKQILHGLEGKKFVFDAPVETVESEAAKKRKKEKANPNDR